MLNKINNVMHGSTTIQNQKRPVDLHLQQPLLECTDIEDTLLEYSWTHFATAEGLTFTREP